MSLIRTDTGAVVPSSSLSLAFDETTNVATIAFAGLPRGALPAGPYAITISARGVTDLAGNRLDRKTSMFFSIAPALAASAQRRAIRVNGTTEDDRIVVRLASQNASMLEVLLKGAAVQRRATARVVPWAEIAASGVTLRRRAEVASLRFLMTVRDR